MISWVVGGGAAAGVFVGALILADERSGGAGDGCGACVSCSGIGDGLTSGCDGLSGIGSACDGLGSCAAPALSSSAPLTPPPSMMVAPAPALQNGPADGQMAW